MAEVKETVAKAAEAAADTAETKTVAKKATADKAETKTTAKKTTAKKTTTKTTKAAAEKKTATAEKKAPAAKKTTEKKAEVKTEINIQFDGKNYTTDDILRIAQDVWKYDLGNKPADMKSVELYVKPEESRVYYVVNGEVTGQFDI